MTYYNGSAYHGPGPDTFAHDRCFQAVPGNMVTVTIPASTDTGPASTYRHQRDGWTWDPVWGAPEPCIYCGGAVQ